MVSTASKRFVHYAIAFQVNMSLIPYINEGDESLSLPVDHLALVVDVLAALVLRDLLADLDIVVPASAAAQDGPEVDRQRHLKAGGQHEDAEDEFLKRGDL